MKEVIRMRAAGMSLLLVLGITMAAVAQGVDEPSPGAPRELRSAPSRISIGSVQIRLTAECWVDLMPPVPRSGAPLYSLLTIEATEKTLPPQVSIRNVWIILSDGRLIAANEVLRRQSDSPTRVQATARFDNLSEAGTAVRVSVELSGIGAAA
ncbi:MAG TPA: hypothetical protein VMW87_14440, partial [Spirochaetia bacterium]|nr:hypothetical protein [Spirochaetia bacterium]